MWMLMLTMTAQADPPYGGKEQAVEHMRGHFDAATRAVWGIARGDLDEVHEAAEELDHRTTEIPVTWRGKVDGMRSAARRLSTSSTVAGASARMGTLAESCSNCHESVPGGPKLAPVQQQMGERDPASDHARAWYWLWLGLSMSDDAAWSSGAQALGAAPEHEKTADQAASWAALGERARAAKLGERGFVFRQAMSACARCHDDAGVKLDAKLDLGDETVLTPGASGPPAE